MDADGVLRPSGQVGAMHTQLGQLQADLAEFEQQCGFFSTKFYRRFQAGQTDDRILHRVGLAATNAR